MDGTIVSSTKCLMFQILSFFHNFVQRVLSALNPSHQPTVLFSIYQTNNWTIRCLVHETIDPVTQRIILKIVGFLLFLLLFLPTFPYLLADISFGSCASFDLNKEEPAVLTKGAKQFVQNPWESSLNSFMNTEP